MNPSSTPATPVDNLENARIAQDLQLRKAQVDAAVPQLNAGWAPVFLARYRSENAGGLNEPALRAISVRLRQNRQLAERRSIILRSIESQGQLTDEIRHSLNAADSMRRLEDLFLPFKPRRRGPAQAARERGLGPLAEAVWAGDPSVGNLVESAEKILDPARGLDSVDKVLDGVSAILSEALADQADLRASVRIILNESGILKASRHPKTSDANAQDFREYFRFSEPMRNLAAHKVFALRRGEKANALEVMIDWNRPAALRLILDRMPLPEPGQNTSWAQFLANWKPLPVPVAPVEAPPVVAAEPAPTEAPAGETPSETTETAAAPVEAPQVENASATGEATPAEAVGSDFVEATTSTEESHTPAEAAAAVESVAVESHPPVRVEDPFPHLPPPHFKFAPPTPEHFAKHPYRPFLEKVAERTIHEFMGPSLEREARRDLGTKADDYAIGICCRTLRMRLLAPPRPGKRVLAIDPAARGGCKVAVLDENGDLIEDGSFNPHPPQARKAEPKHKLEEWIRRHQVEVVVIGNGAGFRHVEGLVAELLQEFDDRRHGRIPVVTEAPPSAEVATEQSVGEIPEATPTAETTAVAEVASSPDPVATETAAEHAPVGHETVGDSATPAELGSTEVQPASESGETTPTEEQSPACESTPDAPAAPSVAKTGKGKGEKGAKKQAVAFVPPPLDHLPLPLESLGFTTVPEVGASFYGASPLGREELPQQDSGLRAVISLGRRYIDSLAEMVKVDPQYLVSGVHASEAQGKALREALEGVLESVVAQVGLDPNRATVAALRYIPGLNPAIARDMIEYRKVIGRFTNRAQLRLVPGMTEDRNVQSVGFLRIAEGDNPLDATWIHPEQYPLAEWILKELGVDASVLRDPQSHARLKQKIETEGPAIEAKAPAAMPGYSNAAVRQVLGELIHGGDDVRTHFPAPILRKGLVPIESLEVGKELEGTVLNVVDFGCFVDIGLKDGGLVHISEMANRFVRSPHEMVHVGEVVKVWIRSVDKEKGRVSLTMIRPGSDRGGPPQHRGERGGQRGRRGPGHPEGHGGGGGPGREGRPDREHTGHRPPRKEGGPGPRGPGRPGDRGPGGRDQGRQGDRGPAGGGRSLPRGLADLPPRGTSLKQMGRKGKPGGGGQGEKPAPQTSPAPESAEKAPAPTTQPQQPKSRKEPPKSPVLSQDALKGASPLGTFAELAAFWNATGDKDSPQPKPPGENPG